MKSKNSRSIHPPARGAEVLYYLSNCLWINNFKRLALAVKRINQFVFHVNIPPAVTIGSRLELAHGGFGVTIHDNTIIGDDVIILHNVTIGNGGTRIGNRVTLATGVVIIGAVTIGDDVTVGANSLIVDDVPANSIVFAPKGIIKNQTSSTQVVK